MREANIVIGLGFGDEGKGTIVDYLARETNASTVIRFNGGAQAAHAVVLPDGRYHVFNQFGAGTLDGCQTFLSKYVMVNPIYLMQEAKALNENFGIIANELMFVDPQCLVLTPIHIAMNRVREQARKNNGNPHGTCAHGIGECMSYYLNDPKEAIYVDDLKYSDVLVSKLMSLHYKYMLFAKKHGIEVTDINDQRTYDALDAMMDQYKQFLKDVTIATALDKQHIFEDTIVMEGAQGVLLDEWYGFHPYTTWSTTTFKNAMHLLREHKFSGYVTKVGVTRAYMTRHGHGPFPSEELVAPDTFNSMNDWQGAFRSGWMDTLLLNYASRVCGGMDMLAVTCLDRLKEYKLCSSYQFGSDEVKILQTSEFPDLDFQTQLTTFISTCEANIRPVDQGELLRMMVQETHTPIGITSHGPSFKQKSRISSPKI